MIRNPCSGSDDGPRQPPAIARRGFGRDRHRGAGRGAGHGRGLSSPNGCAGFAGAHGRPVAEYAALFDTVYISLYKSFNTPSGAILAGPKSLLDGMVDTRRMFGAGLPAAWPFAVVASRYVKGFFDRFRRAVAVSEAFFAELSTRDAFAVERIPHGTNVARVRVAADDLRAFRNRLMAEGIVLPPPSGGSFWVTVNETWSRRSARDLVDHFKAAVGT